LPALLFGLANVLESLDDIGSKPHGKVDVPLEAHAVATFFFNRKP